MRTELVCQSHVGNCKDGMYPTVYSDDPKAKEWRQTISLLFCPPGTISVWICPECQEWLKRYLFNRLHDAQADATKAYNQHLRRLHKQMDDTDKAYRNTLAQVHRRYEQELEHLGLTFVNGQWRAD